MELLVTTRTRARKTKKFVVLLMALVENRTDES